MQGLRFEFCCFCEVILSSRWPNKYYFDNIAILATIGRPLSEKVQKSSNFRFFQISKASKICQWCAMNSKLHKSMQFDGIWITNIKRTIFDVANWENQIHDQIQRYKWRYFEIFACYFQNGFVSFKSNHKPLHSLLYWGRIISLDLRLIDFWLCYQYFIRYVLKIFLGL